jgi:hypothetical protein
VLRRRSAGITSALIVSVIMISSCTAEAHSYCNRMFGCRGHWKNVPPSLFTWVTKNWLSSLQLNNITTVRDVK